MVAKAITWSSAHSVALSSMTDKRTLLVGSTPGSQWLANFLASVEPLKDTGVQVVVLQDYNWHVGKFKWMLENTILSDFVFFHDTMLIHRPIELMDLYYSYEGSVALTDCPLKMGMYLGKWRRETLQQCDLVVPKNKHEAVEQELLLADQYCKIEPGIPTLFPEVNDHNNFEKVWRYGRENLVIGNEYFTKYKLDYWGSGPVK